MIIKRHTSLPRVSRSNRVWSACRLAVLAGSCWLVSANHNPSAQLQASDYHAENIYAQPPRLLSSLQRVAVLPIATTSKKMDLLDGCEALNPILEDELIHIKKFEVAIIKPEDLRFSTGRLAWTGAESLPPNFFETLQRVTGCDAVLFTELTEYKAYSPMIIGWRFKLVDVRTKAILWAGDETFDGQKPASLQKKTILQRIGVNLSQDNTTAWSESVSPQILGHQTISAMLKTLPER